MDTVQIFDLETKVNGIEDIQQHHSLVEELGLKGQDAVSFDKESAPIPYMWLKTTNTRILETLCPVQVRVDQYDKEPIPIEVMQELKKCKKNKYFLAYDIWYDDVDPDPVLIGITEAHFNDYKLGEWLDLSKDTVKNWEEQTSRCVHSIKAYVIARWGDEKKDWSELAVMAKEKHIKVARNVLELSIKTAQRSLEDLGNEAFSKFGV